MKLSRPGSGNKYDADYLGISCILSSVLWNNVEHTYSK